MAIPESVDMFDDDYWFGRDGRKARDFADSFGGSMRRVEELAAALREQAHRGYMASEAEKAEDVLRVGST